MRGKRGEGVHKAHLGKAFSSESHDVIFALTAQPDSRPVGELGEEYRVDKSGERSNV